MVNEMAIAAFKEKKKKKSKNESCEKRGKTWESFLRTIIFGPVGGGNSFSQRV